MPEASAETIVTLAATLVDLYGREALHVARRQAVAQDGLEQTWRAVVAQLSLL